MKKVYYLIVIFVLLGGVFFYAYSREKSLSNSASPAEDPTEISTEHTEKEIRGLRNSPRITILPESIIPGNPVFITIDEEIPTDSIILNNKSLAVFQFEGKTRAFAAIDFDEKIPATTTRPLTVTFADGTIAITPLTIIPHEKKVEPLGIPQKLGGNTPAAQTALVSNLSKENAVLNSIRTATSTLWAKPFRAPLTSLTITDPYGYNRQTGNYTIAHKGTDFRAAQGTPVIAINDGIVRLARTFTVYGNTVAIDHGQGVQSLYMHLSTLNVKEGDTVNAGDVIGLSGQSGYAEVPHLHVSIKINSISIDPMVFLGFFGVTE